MDALINLWEQAGFGERGEPTGRAALLRVTSALAATETDIERVLVGKEKLASEMGKAADVELDLRAQIGGEATSLVEMMKQGVQWTLGQFGNRATRKTAELLNTSSIQAAIGDAALAEAAEELQRLEAKRERLLVARAGIIRETIREALQPALLADYGVILERLQEIVTRLRGVERYLTPPSPDYRPDARRIAMNLPNFARGDGSDQAVVATSAAIGEVEAALAAYAEELSRDPMAPCPELPDVSRRDDGTIYSDLSGPERLEVDRAFVPQIPHHRRTIDSKLFEMQVREAKAFVGLTS
jgi:hypothetical protein